MEKKESKILKLLRSKYNAVSTSSIKDEEETDGIESNFDAEIHAYLYSILYEMCAVHARARRKGG